MLTFYALIHLDGILEDKRSRIAHFLTTMKDLNLVEILIRFINKSQDIKHRDMASHILVLLIDAIEHQTVENEARNFMNTLLTWPEKENLLSLNAYSFAILTLVKNN